jgi:soluble lytic murein transglycosylase-like protein
MGKHLISKLLTALLLVAPTSSALAQGIVGVRQADGRMVFENASPDQKPSPQAESTQSQAANDSGLVYWSRSEHRWKPVPSSTPANMRAAHSAAVEVRRLLDQKSGNQTSTGFTPSAPLYVGRDVKPVISAAQQNTQIYSVNVDSAIQEAAARHDVDANLVRALIRVESNFNPRAVSRKGALGLMQLMPYTARSLQVRNAFDPHENVDAGVRHLKKLLDNYGGNIELSLAAYNAGSSAVQHHGGVPPYTETRNYVKRITELYTQEGSRPFGRTGHPVQTIRDSAGHVLYTDLN